MQHEDASVMMLDHLIKENGLMEEMGKYGLNDNDVDFIKVLIVGDVEKKVSIVSTHTNSSRTHGSMKEGRAFSMRYVLHGIIG